jgi:3-deoxy-D-manno-octulosonic-acid transferase
LVWLHGASVGEGLSMLPLIARLRTSHPATTILVTTGTVTSARLLGERLPPGAVHQYVPVDRPAWVERFLDHWRPELAIWLESEFWPNLIAATAARRIPMALLNGRVSPHSLRNWQRAPAAIAQLLTAFSLIAGQTAEDAERLRQLGAASPVNLGNLKFAADPLPASAADLADLTKTIGNRPRWLAASTHAGEEEIAADVHRRIADRFPGLLTVIVPRHPQRGESIARTLAGQGLTVTRRSLGEMPSDGTQVYVADTLGEMGLFYRLADIVFVGGSLVPHGGQNPLEPARLDDAVLLGPEMTNFREMAERMIACGGAETVADAEGLATAVAGLLADPAERARRALAARHFAEGEAQVLDRIMAALEPFLGPPPSVAKHAHA